MCLSVFRIFLINIFLIICHINCIQQTYVLYKKYGFLQWQLLNTKKVKILIQKYHTLYVTWQYDPLRKQPSLSHNRNVQGDAICLFEDLKVWSIISRWKTLIWERMKRRYMQVSTSMSTNVYDIKTDASDHNIWA